MEVGKAGRSQEEGSLAVCRQHDQGAGGSYPGRAGRGHAFDGPKSHQDEDEELTRHSDDMGCLEFPEKETSQVSIA